MKRIVLIAFIIIPALIAASTLVLPQKNISTKENRILMTNNSVSLSFKNGEFQNDLEDLLSDQFPFRETLAFIQSKTKLLLGSREINGAYVCSDGRLIQKIIEADFSENALLGYASRINGIAKKHKLYVMYVPSAGIMLESELPKGAPMYDYEKLYKALTSRLDSATVISLKSYLNSQEYYYKTDHHWNAYGAYQAYTAFCKARDELPKKLEQFNLKPAAEDFQGTLYFKAPVTNSMDEILLPSVSVKNTAADGKEISFYDYSALKTKDKYNVFQGGNHGIVEIEGNADNGKTLLILKDSFANSFVPYITDEYSKIIMLDERYTFVSLDEYINNLKPDEILVLKEIIS